jgi:hypothetical protein
MKNAILKKRIRQCAAVLLAAATIVTAGAVTISNVEVGNVTTTGFCLCWETSESSLPGLEVFSDAGGTQSLAGEVAVEFFPLAGDQRAVASSVAIREAGRTLRDDMRARNVVLVRVSGLQPGTEYSARPTALDTMGATIASGDLQAVTSSQTLDFVGESRQVEIDLSALEFPGSPVAGAILTITTPSAAYPLLAVVGDCWSPTRAYADLTQFLDAAGDRNLLPSGIMPLTITWKGLEQVPGVFTGPDVDYDGSLVVAHVTRLAFDVAETDVDFIITFLKEPAVVGLPLDIGLEAQGPGAVTLLDYDRSALIGTTGSLMVGDGPTAPFVDGLLSSHTVVFNAPGQVDLTVSDPFGASVSSASIEVLPLTYDKWRLHYFGDTIDPAGNPDANPDSDELTNKGEFTTLRNPLVVSTSPLGVRQSPGGITVSLDFNRFQSEYRVRFQTTVDLKQWNDSAIGPSVQQSLPDRDIVAAFFPNAEFNNQPFGAVRAVFELIPVTPVHITGVSLNGVILVINFTGVEGVSDWRVMGSADLVTFPFDRSADSIIIETSPGNYRADVDLSAGSPAAYFVRIER